MKGGYLQLPPVDTTHNMRAEMSLMLEQLGIPVEVFHHETAAQGKTKSARVFPRWCNAPTGRSCRNT
jgi:glutamine synthetase